MSKPDFLYHASPNKNITILEPKSESVRDPDEGPVVFASTSPERVSKFLIGSDDSWSQLSRFDDLDVAIYSDRNRFFENDHGGAIYKLPSDSFYLDPKYTHSKNEWTSKDSVIPISKITYDSAYNAMTQYGIKIYFVDQKTLSAIQNATDHGFSILQTLKPDNQ